VLVAGLLLSLSAGCAPAPERRSVLLIGTGEHPEEAAILERLTALENFDLFTIPDFELDERTALEGYGLIVATGVAPNVSDQGLEHIMDSGVPLLLLESDGFPLAKRIGLVDGRAEVRCLDSGVIRAAASGVDRFRRFVGSEVVVLHGRSRVCGVAPAALATDVVPLYWSLLEPEEAAAFYSESRGVFALGFDAPTRFAESGWRIFDLAIDQLRTIGPSWKSQRQVAQGYANSGLRDLIEAVREDPEGWPAAEVVSAVWIKMVTWNLLQLGPYLDAELRELLPDLVFLPPWSTPPSVNPHTVCSASDDSRWFLGQDCSSNPFVPQWSELISGTDLGISVKHFGGTLFYLGDTYPWTSKHSTSRCDSGAVCNDAIVALAPGENDPSDGVDAVPYTKYYYSAEETPYGYEISAYEGYEATSVPGIHTGVWDPGFWVTQNNGETWDPNFTVPSGAVSTTRTFELVVGQPPYPTISVPTVVLFYATAAAPPTVYHGYSNRTPHSWAACSFDGITFHRCYPPGIPFSRDEPGEPARFVQVAPVEISAGDLATVCGGASSAGNPLCKTEIYDASAPVGGLLLFGAGRHYRRSGLYVAYIRADELGATHKPIASGPTRPKVRYLTKDGSGKLGWSFQEKDATYLVPKTASPALQTCDGLLTSNDCSAQLVGDLFLQKIQLTDLFGEFSVKLVSDGVAAGSSPHLVMLSYHDFAPGVQLRTTSLEKFWEWSTPTTLDAHGYGPYIIDEFTNFSESNATLELWFTTSKWDGTYPNYTNYGIYTDHAEISPWPPSP